MASVLLAPLSLQASFAPSEQVCYVPFPHPRTPQLRYKMPKNRNSYCFAMTLATSFYPRSPLFPSRSQKSVQVPILCPFASSLCALICDFARPTKEQLQPSSCLPRISCRIGKIKSICLCCPRRLCMQEI